MSHARAPCDGVATARAAYSPHALSPMSTAYNNLALPRLDHTTCLPALQNFFRTYHSSWLASARSVVFIPTLTASEEGTYPALTHELLPSVTHSLLTGSNLSYLNPCIFYLQSPSFPFHSSRPNLATTCVATIPAWPFPTSNHKSKRSTHVVWPIIVPFALHRAPIRDASEASQRLTSRSGFGTEK